MLMVEEIIRRTPLRRFNPATGPKWLARSPIAKRSAKQRRRQAGLVSILRRIIAETGGICEIRSPICTGTIQGTHHLRKRSQGGGDERENLKGSCNPCNSFIECNPLWALAHGFTITRKAF